MDAAVTYSSYLKINELLGLQVPLSDGPEHDEHLFIVIHQVYELWFKEVLHELDHARSMLDEGNTARVRSTLKRVLTIMKVLVAQLDILETMTPLDFISFRTRLESASGFQSGQFRELEFALGAKRPGVVDAFPEGSRERENLARRLEEPSLWNAFLRYLANLDYPVPQDVLDRDVRGGVEPSEALQEVFINVYRTDGATAGLCERLVDLDEGLQEWRYRHVKMVERTIGNKRGSGGSSGVDYLASTLGKPVFPDLWEIRTRL